MGVRSMSYDTACCIVGFLFFVVIIFGPFLWEAINWDKLPPPENHL